MILQVCKVFFPKRSVSLFSREEKLGAKSWVKVAAGRETFRGSLILLVVTFFAGNSDSPNVSKASDISSQGGKSRNPEIYMNTNAFFERNDIIWSTPKKCSFSDKGVNRR